MSNAVAPAANAPREAIVTFVPSGRRASLKAGQTLFDACRIAGQAVPAPCGGKGWCGKCRVRVLHGDAPPTPEGLRILGEAEIRAGWRLACRLQATSDLVVEARDVDARSAILSDFSGRDPVPDNPIRAAPLAMPPPSLDDQACDLSRVARALGRDGGLVCGLELLRELPGKLRAHGFAGVAFLRNGELLDFAPPDAPAEPLGLAIDLGTTTMAAVLCELSTGKSLAVAATPNPQAIHGDDVVTRIERAGSSPAAARELSDLAVGAIGDLLARACQAAGVDPARVLTMTVGGNTTMNHLLLGLDAAGIAASPFIPCSRRGRWLRGRELGLPCAAGAYLYTLPNISAYIGGDIVAGLLAHRPDAGRPRALLLDVGTNGEMALYANGRALSCSTAAGPAFEGARISCGMRAAPGAVAEIAWTPTSGWRARAIDDAPPRGLCGTGLLDAAAALLDLGVVDETGRLLDADEWAEGRPGLPEDLRRRRVRLDNGEEAFILASDPAAAAPPVTLTQRDLREFQLAKGAVAAGIDVLLKAAGLRPEDLDAVWLAGGFGSFLRPASALRTGLLPEGVALDRVSAVGNAALAGARLCLLSEAHRAEAEAIARTTEYLELSGRADFQAAFAERMMFPESIGGGGRP